MFPTSEYEHNDFYDAVGPILGLLMSLSLVYPLSMLVRGLVEEREKRLKETMCIMGLQGVPPSLCAAHTLTPSALFCAVQSAVVLPYLFICMCH